MSSRRSVNRLHVGVLPLVCFGVSIACGSGHRSGAALDDTPLDRLRYDDDAGPVDNAEPPHADAADAGASDAGAPPSDSGALANPDAGEESCGNGQLDGNEACDTALVSSESCVVRGFDTGLLSCNADCSWSTADCSGTESCYDGRDNDGDGLIDCDDVAECAGQCADACAAPLLLPENSSVSGTTIGHAASLAASCSDTAPSGAEVVYQVNVSEDAKLDVLLSSDRDLTLSLRTSCAEPGTELRCGGQTRFTLDALAGETYFVVVDGATAADSGNYLLELQARQQACGDGIRDVGEACDDGNINDGDGCDADCAVELSESEPNNLRFQADTFDFTPWFARISPAGDADFYRVQLVATSSTLVVTTANLADGACGFNLMDTVIDILDTSANSFALLTTDDDSGDGKCARAVAPDLGPGTYFVRVRAAAGADPATFPYRLDVSVAICGDGEVSPGEECDDADLDPGDGCDQDCRREVLP